MALHRRKKIALFPEASFGSALNCVGIAQRLAEQGAEPVFLTMDGFDGVFADYGFQEFPIPLEARPSDEEAYRFWQAFLDRHLPHFNLKPIDQIDTYVRAVWEAGVDTAVRAEQGLSKILSQISPDLIVLDNVIMFPAVANQGCPWVRVVSCAENELPDDKIPPALSGMSADQTAACQKFRQTYDTVLSPVHEDYNQFRAAQGLERLPGSLFLEPSPDLNLLLSPSIVRHDRAVPLNEERFVFLEGCIRNEQPYDVPRFAHAEQPLVYTSFGSLGSADVELFERLIAAFSGLPARFLVNVGAQIGEYGNVPDNVHLSEWFPQPSVVAQADLFFHHGGNNSFCEALYHGVPSLIMPYCWDGHDNAVRATQTGVGAGLGRGDWTPEGLRTMLFSLLSDGEMKARLVQNARHMQEADGAGLAARRILQVLETQAS